MNRPNVKNRFSLGFISATAALMGLIGCTDKLSPIQVSEDSRVQVSAALPPDCVAYFPFENNVWDCSGYYTPTYFPYGAGYKWVNATRGKALMMTLGDYGGITSGISDKITSGFTYEVWIYGYEFGKTATGWNMIVNNDVSGLAVSNGKLALLAGGSTWIIPNIAQLATYKWYHLALTYDLNQVRLYIDGQLSYSQTRNYPIAPRNEVEIGGGIGQPKFRGLIDEIRVYNFAASQTTIQGDMYGHYEF